MTKIFVDTDVIIDYSKGYKNRLGALLQEQDEGKAELYVNPVVIAEFFTDQSLRSLEKLSQAFEFFGLFRVEDLTRKTGFLAGELLREGRVAFLGDALIGASCLGNGLRLFTGKRRHFKKIPRLGFYENRARGF